MRALAIVLIMLANSGNPRSDRTGGRQEVRAGDRGKSHIVRGGSGGGAGGGGGGSWAFCDQLSSGDKAGNYDCVNGDGTSASDSTHTFAGINSPAVTSGTTCGSPSYTTMVAASAQYYRTGTFTAATGDQTICALVGATTVDGMMGVGDVAGSNTLAQESGGLKSAYASPTGGACVASNTVPGDSTPVLVCIRWQASAHTVSYFVGPNIVVNTSSCSGSLSALANARVLFGCDAFSSCTPGSHMFGGKFYGGFWTGTALSDGRLTAINAAVTCS
jgi:hypothetical protein